MEEKKCGPPLGDTCAESVVLQKGGWVEGLKEGSGPVGGGCGELKMSQDTSPRVLASSWVFS